MKNKTIILIYYNGRNYNHNNYDNNNMDTDNGLKTWKKRKFLDQNQRKWENCNISSEKLWLIICPNASGILHSTGAVLCTLEQKPFFFRFLAAFATAFFLIIILYTFLVVAAFFLSLSLSAKYTGYPICSKPNCMLYTRTPANSVNSVAIRVMWKYCHPL